MKEEEKKVKIGKQQNPHPDWRMWIVTATIIIQLLNSIQYYQAWNQLQDSAELQKQVLQHQVESLKAINQALDGQK